MRKVRFFIVISFLFVGSFILWNNNPSFREVIKSYVENGEFLTLEARFSPDQIMNTHRTELLPDDQYIFQQPVLRFYPYLLMDVKYTQPGGKTREGVILWSMVDGEMVLDTETWEKTHGFEDAINAGATTSDFTLMNVLAKYRGSLPLDKLQKELKLEEKDFEQSIQGALQKHLVIQRGSEIALHFQNPKFFVLPQTRINQWLVTKPYNHAQRVSKRYSERQIERVARAAFGNDFAVRNAKEVFLPIYNIEVLNPDGSVLTSYWNALNGNRIDNKYLSLAQ